MASSVIDKPSSLASTRCASATASPPRAERRGPSGPGRRRAPRRTRGSAPRSARGRCAARRPSGEARAARESSLPPSSRSVSPSRYTTSPGAPRREVERAPDVVHLPDHRDQQRRRDRDLHAAELRVVLHRVLAARSAARRTPRRRRAGPRSSAHELGELVRAVGRRRRSAPGRASRSCRAPPCRSIRAPAQSTRPHAPRRRRRAPSRRVSRSL